MPPESAFTYGLINNLSLHYALSEVSCWFPAFNQVASHQRGRNYMNENNQQYRFKLLSAVSDWLAGIEREGQDGHLFYGSLVTMMFHHISGSHRSRCGLMFSEAERVYNTLLRHVVHHPNRRGSWAKCPIMVMAPDL